HQRAGGRTKRAQRPGRLRPRVRHSPGQSRLQRPRQSPPRRRTPPGRAVMSAPILEVRNLKKTYSRGLISKRTTFSLEGSFKAEKPEIIGVMGPNGAGKTTLFEMLSGSNVPTGGQILCGGQDIQGVKYRERDRMVIHYHQSYQVRSVKRTKPNFMLQPAPSSYPLVHIF